MTEKNREHLLNEQIQKNDRAIKELSIRLDMLNREISLLIDSLQIHPEGISEFLSNPNNFSKEQWDFLHQEKQKLDAKLSFDNALPMQQKKSREEDKQIARHWLFVK